MANVGYIKLWRKLREDWKWTNPRWRSAWVWMLLEAVWELEGRNGLQRGQLRFDLSQAKAAWGMSTSAAARFLSACEENGDIVWSRCKPWRKGAVDNWWEQAGNNFGKTKSSGTGVITIVNYTKYQPHQNASQPVDEKNLGNDTQLTESKYGALGPLPEQSNARHSEIPILRTKNYISRLENRDSGSPKKPKKKATKDLVEIQQALDNIDLTVFKKKYKGIDVDRVWERFTDTCVNGTPKNPTPNPYNYKNFSMGFHNWCKNAEERGPNRPGGGTTDEGVSRYRKLVPGEDD